MLKLLPPDQLVKTGDVDHADWNYKPVVGAISRSRFSLIKKLLGKRHFGRMLEIGYGSGVFLPELKKYADELCGIDIHNKQAEVAARLAGFDVRAELASGSATEMKWEAESFDAVVAVSALEFIEDLDGACREVRRVLKPDGSFFIVTPGHSPVADFGLKVLTGKSAKTDFDDRREQILPTLKRHFDVQLQVNFPRVTGALLKLYTALELTTARRVNQSKTELESK